MRGTLIFSLILAILAVVFALANPQQMDVNLVVAQIEGSTALVLILTLVIGVIIGILATIPSIYRERKKRKMVEKGDDPTATATTKEPSESGSVFGSKKKSVPPSEQTPEAEDPGSRSSTSSGTSRGTPLGREAGKKGEDDFSGKV